MVASEPLTRRYTARWRASPARNGAALASQSLAADRPDALLEGQGGGELGDGPGADQQGLCCGGGEKGLDPWGSGLPDQQWHQQRGVQVSGHQ